MNRFLFVILVVSAIVGLVGCGVTGTSSTSGYFPHQDGYQWVYKGTFLIGTTESSVLKKTMSFNGATTLPSGLTVQNTIISEEVGAFAIKAFDTPDSYYYVNENGVYTYGSSAYPTTEAMLIIPLPLEVGKTWNRGKDFVCEAVTLEEITVPAGTFMAIKVQVGDSSFHEWYVDKVGLVKIFIDNVTFYTSTGEGVVGVFEELVSKNF